MMKTIELWPRPVLGPTRIEHVREAGHGRAKVGARAVAPDLSQCASAAPPHVFGVGMIGDAEAGGQNDGIDRAFHAIVGHDTGGPHLADMLCDHVNILAAQRRIEIVGEQDALAADRVVWGQSGAQRGILYLPLQVPARDPFGCLQHARPIGEAEDERLALPVDPAAREALGHGSRAEEGARARTYGAIQARQNPRRGTLKQVELADARLDLRDELDGGGARADDRDALAVEAVAVVPARRVKDGSLKSVAAPVQPELMAR